MWYVFLSVLLMEHAVKKIVAIAIVLLCLSYNPAFCQGVVNQEAIRNVVESQDGAIESVQKASWQVYSFDTLEPKNKKATLRSFHAYINTIKGSYTLADRIHIIELSNRIKMEYLKRGDKLLIPSFFENDFRAYAPYPFTYPIAKAMPKLFIIDKYTQTFAAYEHGRLARWGLVCTGKSNDATPAGRYNFNWKVFYRLSNAAPEGEEWHLFWVFNFYAKIGLHTHQYALPINTPASHGCVRMARPDAQWNYNWANGWTKTRNGLTQNGTPVLLINDNPAGKAAHWDLASASVSSQVRLPEDFNQIPLGAAEQKLAPWESGQ
jgi:hypothetical protein